MITIQRFIKSLDIRITLIIFSLLAVAWLQVPRLTDGFRVDEDFRTFYWMNKFQDPSLFPDKTQGYTLISIFGKELPVTFRSLGYGLLFYGTSFFVTPILFSKILPFFLAVITTLYLFEFGRSLRDWRIGVVLATGFLFINLASSSAISISNGLQRSFATTLVIILIYYLHRRKYVAASLALLISVLIYAPAFALGAVIWGIHILKAESILSLSALVQRGMVHLITAFFLCAIIISPAVIPRLPDAVATENSATATEFDNRPASETSQYIWNNPKHTVGGSAQLFVIFPIVGRGGLVDLGEDLVNLLSLLALSGLIILVRGRKAFDLPYEIWGLLWASILVYILAWLAALLVNSFVLYLPSRYTRVGLFLFLFMFVFLNAIDSVKEAPTLIQRNPRRVIWLIVGFELLVVGLLFLYPTDRATISGFNMKWLLGLAGAALGILGVAIIKEPPRSTPNLSKLRQTPANRALLGMAILLFVSGWAVYAPILTEVSYLNPPPAERELLQFLKTVPKNALIAGTPCALDSVELLAKRTVFFSCERPGEDMMVRQALNAYYTDDWQVVDDFCEKYNIDYLVVDLETYSDEYLAQGWIFFEPYNRELLPYVASRDRFVLAQVPDEVKLFQSENYFVVACSDLEKME